jgi:transcriptional regulator with GAF, ATPase, and Fis domain
MGGELPGKFHDPRGAAEQRIVAEATTSGESIIARLGDAAVAEACVPESNLYYVVRTRESVILDDASADNPFSGDKYVREHHARSILCLPLINQAKLIGVLYLENNLTPHAFTPSRIAVLKLLASQAAIYLENTRLYRDLEEREAKIRRLVDANIMGIFIWNLQGEIIEANEAEEMREQWLSFDYVADVLLLGEPGPPKSTQSFSFAPETATTLLHEAKLVSRPQWPRLLLATANRFHQLYVSVGREALQKAVAKLPKL